MDLENLNQFNKKLFKKFFGIYIKEKRIELDLTHEKLAEMMGDLDVKSIKSIETGQKAISQKDLDLFCYYLQLDQQELINIGRITQVQNILDFVKETDAFYPR
jgi:transcriptional regulator with XRE-family HTH domain